MEETLYDVVVIGGGISGLTTAYHLKKRDKNLRVIVLEAKDRVGGRTQTLPLKSRDGTQPWDVGGQWVGRCQPHIMSLLLELGLETHPQYLDGRKVQQLGGLAITTYSGDLPSLSLLALLDLHRLISKIEKLCKKVKPVDPYACRKAKEWDAISAEEFIQQSCFTQGAIDAVLAANRTIYGVELSQISLLFWLMYFSAADGIVKIIEAKEFTGQEATIKGGAQQISELLAKHVGRENVRLGDPALALQQDDQTVKVTTISGQHYTANFAVLALPPPLLNKIKFSPSLPVIKQQLCNRMTIGNYIKIIITYKEAFWRSAGYSGEVVSNGGRTAVQTCSSGPVSVSYDACLHNGSPALLAFIAGDVCVEWTQQSAEGRRRAVLDQLADYFGQDVYSYQDYVEKDWNQEPYSLGGPVCSMPTGTMPIFAKAIRQPFMRLHFAGTETATAWCGYMNGAVQAGLRAASEILEIVRPQALTSEDFGALEGSRPVSKPPRGLSEPRWLLQPYKNSEAGVVFKWTLTFCAVLGLAFLFRRNKLTYLYTKF